MAAAEGSGNCLQNPFLLPKSNELTLAGGAATSSQTFRRQLAEKFTVVIKSGLKGI